MAKKPKGSNPTGKDALDQCREALFQALGDYAPDRQSYKKIDEFLDDFLFYFERNLEGQGKRDWSLDGPVLIMNAKMIGRLAVLDLLLSGSTGKVGMAHIANAYVPVKDYCDAWGYLARGGKPAQTMDSYC